MPKEDKKAVFDVAKPGSTAPDSSAKPIIVSHRPIVKDPTINEGPAEDAEIASTDAEPSLKAPSEKTGAKNIEPPKADTEKRESEKDEAADDQPKMDEPEETEVQISDDSADDPGIDSKENDKKKKDKNVEEESARQEQINKLIESKKYFIRVKAPKAKRNKRAVFVFLFVLVLGLLGVAVAADAELIPLKVPFDFIKNPKLEATTDITAMQDKGQADQTKSSEQDTNLPATKTYIDTAKIFSLSYPATWSQSFQEDGNDGQETATDWTKESRPFVLKPQNASSKEIEVIGGIDIQNMTLDSVWNSRTIDKYNTYEKTKINGYDAIYHKSDYKTAGTPRWNIEHTYFLQKDDNVISLSFMQVAGGDESEGDTNFDASQYLPDFNSIVNSVKFL